jgi:hypothetical protein
MPVVPPKCRFCDTLHWSRMCPKYHNPKVRVMSEAETKKARAAQGPLLLAPPDAKAAKPKKKGKR